MKLGKFNSFCWQGCSFGNSIAWLPFCNEDHQWRARKNSCTLFVQSLIRLYFVSCIFNSICSWPKHEALSWWKLVVSRWDITWFKILPQNQKSNNVWKKIHGRWAVQLICRYWQVFCFVYLLCNCHSNQSCGQVHTPTNLKIWKQSCSI